MQSCGVPEPPASVLSDRSCRIHRTPRNLEPPNPLRLALLQIGAISVILLAFLPRPGLAHNGPPGPDGLPQAAPRHAWKIFTGAPCADTLAAGWRDVLPAARRALEADNWKIFTADTARGEMVTCWKALHHPLLWLFMGKVKARCTVEIRPLGPFRTRMVFEGALASHHNLEGSPMFCTRPIGITGMIGGFDRALWT